jgi:RNA polymerase sigma-70 factor (ECF subfamily)
MLALVAQARDEVRSDLELIEAIRDGDEAAFTIVYERYFQRIHNFAFARLHNRADAEEAAQDTFTIVFRSAGGYQGKASLLSWVYGIAKNVVNNQLRRSQAYHARLLRSDGGLARSAGSLDMCTPEEALSLVRCGDALDESLSGLKDWQAEAFELRHFDDLGIQDIADRMSKSNDAIRSSLYRAKRRVIDAVDPDLQRSESKRKGRGPA